MKINDEYANDPEEKEISKDPIASKFRVISKYSDMPKEYQEIHGEMYRNALEMIKTSDLGDTHLAAVQYAAFLSVQIASLQQDTKQLYRILEEFAKAMDRMESKM